MGALVRVNGGIEKGQWRRWSGSMVALVRVNGGIEKVNGRWSGSIEQWGLNGGIEKDQWGHWSGSMGVLKRVNGGRWSGSMGAWRRVRSDKGLALGRTEDLPCRVVSSTLQGCKLYLAGLQGDNEIL